LPILPLLESLLGVHRAPNSNWLADAASTAAERGLGALYSLLYLTDASGQLAGERPAAKGRMPALTRVHQALDTDLTTLKFDPRERPALASAMQEGHAVAVPELAQALPLRLDPERLHAAQRQLGVAEAWLAPLHWNGESLGLLLLLMPASPPAPLALAELLGRHVAVALGNLREKEAGRKRGELDAVRWVYDEQRFLEQLAQEIRRAQRHGRPLSILLLRVQDLEGLRTRYGRFLAEQMLRQVAGRLANAIRDTDFLGASREDGFATILVEADQEGAQRAEERLLTSLHTMKLPHADLPDFHIQLACATATLSQDGETAEELTAAAEARLAGNASTQQEVA
jgi:diguanylate cyclase (GGDEF)-like protein